MDLLYLYTSPPRGDVARRRDPRRENPWRDRDALEGILMVLTPGRRRAPPFCAACSASRKPKESDLCFLQNGMLRALFFRRRSRFSSDGSGDVVLRQVERHAEGRAADRRQGVAWRRPPARDGPGRRGLAELAMLGTLAA